MQLPRWPAPYSDTIEQNHKHAQRFRVEVRMYGLFLRLKVVSGQEHRGQTGQRWRVKLCVFMCERKEQNDRQGERKRSTRNEEWSRKLKRGDCVQQCDLQCLGCREYQPLGDMGGMAKSLLHKTHRQTGSGQTNTHTKPTHTLARTTPEPGASL